MESIIFDWSFKHNGCMSRMSTNMKHIAPVIQSVISRPEDLAIKIEKFHLPDITLNMDILVKLVEGFLNKYENRLIKGSVAHEKATNRLNINPGNGKFC